MVFAGCAVLATLAFGGCAFPDPGTFEPVLTPITVTNSKLRDLPRPSRRVTVAVYQYQDLTGQFREEPTVQTLSRAVTQGASSILINSLHEAGNGRWFTVLDRADLNNLLKERQIVSEMRRIYLDENRIEAKHLPPLNFASIILDGGIIGYDTNTLTGGAGAQYLGIGANASYKQDTVTVSLRAVSTKSGEVLASVTVHKTIASVALQGNVFRFVDPNALLEAEAGITHNEPKELAVRQAIEKAVYALIMQGADTNVWHFADRTTGRALVRAYLAEKYGGAEAAAVARPMASPATIGPSHIRPITAGEEARAARERAAKTSAPADAPAPNGPPAPGANEKPLGALPPDVRTPRFAAIRAAVDRERANER
jgi:curli production assembly/transport component CsgG